jgi:hypothetical protein
MTEKMPALFKVYPPKSKLTTLDEVVDDWIYRFGKKGVQRERRDLVVDFCAKAKSLDMAIWRACRSKDANGKHHNHQSRVPMGVLESFANEIRSYVGRPKTFDELYDRLDDCKPSGIGPVTTYDVATRIAAFLKLDVTSLYLHAGVRIGWCLLHGRRSPDQLRIPREALPKALRRLPTDEIEDFLCAYRSFFKPWLKEDSNAKKG